MRHNFKNALKFESLRNWQISLDLPVEIHELTKTFPKDELFILTSQIKRAADSVTLKYQKDQHYNQIMSLSGF